MTPDMAGVNNLLKDYQNALPLPTEINADGKSLMNLSGPKSSCYDDFPKPIESSNNGFDFHSEHCILWCSTVLTRVVTTVYYQPNNQQHVKYARDLHERIRREFPEVCLLGSV